MRKEWKVITKLRLKEGIINATTFVKCWTPPLRMIGWYPMSLIQTPHAKIPKELEMCIRQKIQWIKNPSGNLSKKKSKSLFRCKILFEIPLLRFQTIVKARASIEFYLNSIGMRSKWWMLRKKKWGATAIFEGRRKK